MSFVDCQNGSLSLVVGKKGREKREGGGKKREKIFIYVHVYKNVECFHTHTHTQVCLQL